MKEGRVFARFSAEEKGMQVRSNLFTSVEIYRKCLASTYHGWGLQSLVSEEKKQKGGREAAEKKIIVSVLFFTSSLA